MERKRWREDGTRIPLYKENITNREPVAVIHVPCTPNSGLVIALREGEIQMEEISGVKFKFKEKTGKQLSRVICKTVREKAAPCVKRVRRQRE